MRTYADLLALEGTSELVSYAGGRHRYVNWEMAPHTSHMLGTLMGHTVIMATPDWVQVTTAGHNTPSTVEALSVSLFGGGGYFYNRGGELFYGAARMTDGMVLEYSGAILSHGSQLSPVRGADAERDGDIIDVATNGRARRPVAEVAARRLLLPGERLKLDDGEVPQLYTFRVLR